MLIEKAQDSPDVGAISALDSEYSSVLMSFCADTLVSHLNESPLSAHEEISSRSWNKHGACLLVDISGFTRLSGELCAAGDNGLDELRQITSGYLSRLLHSVYSNGGDGKYIYLSLYSRSQ